MLETPSNNPARPKALPYVPPADSGLICGFVVSPDANVAAIELEDIDDRQLNSSAVIWLHFNLTNARARQAIARLAFIPREVQEALCEQDDRRRVDVLDEGLLAVVSDLT